MHCIQGSLEACDPKLLEIAPYLTRQDHLMALETLRPRQIDILTQYVRCDVPLANNAQLKSTLMEQYLDLTLYPIHCAKCGVGQQETLVSADCEGGPKRAMDWALVGPKGLTAEEALMGHLRAGEPPAAD